MDKGSPAVRVGHPDTAHAPIPLSETDAWLLYQGPEVMSHGQAEVSASFDEYKYLQKVISGMPAIPLCRVVGYLLNT